MFTARVHQLVLLLKKYVSNATLLEVYYDVARLHIASAKTNVSALPSCCHDRWSCTFLSSLKLTCCSPWVVPCHTYYVRQWHDKVRISILAKCDSYFIRYITIKVANGVFITLFVVNTMGKEKGQTAIYKTLHRKLKIE